MRRIRVAGTARREFEEAIGHVARRNPAAARALARRLQEAQELVARRPRIAPLHPSGGGARLWHVSGPNYSLVFDHDDTTLTVLRIWHGARGWPPAES